jgi:3',5'-cyclic AMP phosphodiesterase CpdA
MLAGSAGAALASPLWAGQRSANPDTWALLSDVHIAADPEFTARGVKMSAHLRQAVNEVLGLSELPTAALVCGDCAYGSGQTGDYALLTRLLQPLRESGMPVHLALGNHDHRERFFDAIAWANDGVRRPLEDKHVRMVRSPRVNWFILDSLEKTESTPGFLGQEQLEWLAGALDANKDKPALVMVHHNPGVAGHLGLKDTVALFEVIRPRKQVKAYFFGHTHVWSIERDSTGLHLVNLPAVAYVFQEGEPSGWVHAVVEQDRAILEFHAINPSHKAHRQRVELPWREA